MTLRTIVAIIIYIFIALVTYVVVRVMQDLDDDSGEMLAAWLLAMVWPAFLGIVIASIPFCLIGAGIDKLIYFVQTKIIEAKCRRTKEKE